MKSALNKLLICALFCTLTACGHDDGPNSKTSTQETEQSLETTTTTTQVAPTSSNKETISEWDIDHAINNFHRAQANMERYPGEMNYASGTIVGLDAQYNFSDLSFQIISMRNDSFGNTIDITDVYAEMIRFHYLWEKAKQDQTIDDATVQQKLRNSLFLILYNGRMAYRVSNLIANDYKEEDLGYMLPRDLLSPNYDRFVMRPYIGITQNGNKYTCYFQFTLPNGLQRPNITTSSLLSFVRKQNIYLHDLYQFAATTARTGFDQETGKIINPEALEAFSNHLNYFHPDNFDWSGTRNILNVRTAFSSSTLTSLEANHRNY